MPQATSEAARTPTRQSKLGRERANDAVVADSWETRAAALECLQVAALLRRFTSHRRPPHNGDSTETRSSLAFRMATAEVFSGLRPHDRKASALLFATKQGVRE